MGGSRRAAGRGKHASKVGGKIRSPSSRRRRRQGWLALVVGLLSLVPFLNGLQADFTLDDVKVIRDNPMVTGGESPLRLLTWVDRPEIYRPVTMLTYVANAQTGRGTLGYHLVNVGLHVLVTLAVFRLAWVVLDSPVGTVATAALFATHPIHTEAVTNIVGRAELLAALLVLGSLLAQMQASRDEARHRTVWFVVSLTTFAGSLLAKESALTAIVLFAVVHAWYGLPRSVRRTAIVLSPYVLIAMAYLGLRAYLVGSLTMPTPPSFLDNPLAHVSALPRLQTALVVLWEYLLLLALPFRLSADYSFNQVPIVVSALDPRFLLATGTFASLAIGLWLSVKRAPQLVLAGAFLFAPLALTTNVLFTIGTIKAERLLYLPSFGWCLACGWLVMRFAGRWYRWSIMLLALIVTAYGARAWVRNRDWHDNATVYAATVETSPGSAKAHYNWGTELVRHGRLDDAIHHLSTAVVILPDYGLAHGNLGLALAMKGRLADATWHYREAARIEPANPLALYNLGRILELQGRVDEAAQQLAAAVRVNPGYADAQYLVGTLLLRQGKLDEAIRLFAETLEIKPDHADAHHNWGVALERQGRIEEAIRHYTEAVRIKPDHVEARESLRRALIRRDAASGR